MGCTRGTLIGRLTAGDAGRRADACAAERRLGAPGDRGRRRPQRAAGTGCTVPGRLRAAADSIRVEPTVLDGRRTAHERPDLRLRPARRRLHLLGDRAQHARAARSSSPPATACPRGQRRPEPRLHPRLRPRQAAVRHLRRRSRLHDAAVAPLGKPRLRRRGAAGRAEPVRGPDRRRRRPRLRDRPLPRTSTSRSSATRPRR